ncbi:MAG: DNA methyltransferase [Elusimicrobiota bacterium]
MREVNDKSVHLVVTSPPYWNLKDYGTENQIGFFDTYEVYLDNLFKVFSECHRVLHDGCKLCLNIADIY